MVIELRVVQFWSEIILVISNRTRAARSFDFEITRIISDQIALHPVQLPLFIIYILKSLVIPAIWLALSRVVFLRITLFFALNHNCSKSRHSCSKSHHFCFNSHHFCSAHYFCFEYKMRCKRFCFHFLRNRLLDQWNISANWILWFQMAVINW